MKVTVGFLASKLLSKDEKSGLRFEKLIVAAQSNQLDRPVQISELLEISDCLFGELKVPDEYEFLKLVLSQSLKGLALEGMHFKFYILCYDLICCIFRPDHSCFSKVSV